jgi:hypothetical protein
LQDLWRKYRLISSEKNIDGTDAVF